MELLIDTYDNQYATKKRHFINILHANRIESYEIEADKKADCWCLYLTHASHIKTSYHDYGYDPEEMVNELVKKIGRILNQRRC